MTSIERDLVQGLDRLDQRHLEMQFFVRRPLHASFGFGKLVDQTEQPVGVDQFRLGRRGFAATSASTSPASASGFAL